MAAGTPSRQISVVHFHHVALVNVQVALPLGELLNHIEPCGPTGHLVDRVGTLGRIDQMICCRRPWGTDRQADPFANRVFQLIDGGTPPATTARLKSRCSGITLPMEISPSAPTHFARSKPSGIIEAISSGIRRGKASASAEVSINLMGAPSPVDYLSGQQPPVCTDIGLHVRPFDRRLADSCAGGESPSESNYSAPER